ncbi:hypothetical protein Psi02_09090 [Planotetraspora silvatica]|uniref:Uncharacterized protein n=1 Tax=Planotetraspora silvatica TaxID=234614 RepID=A0A8J3UGZ7_9ACTN|nr:hypothetical protein Psi02_09090 [Planotetraspora silvatica]
MAVRRERVPDRGRHPAEAPPPAVGVLMGGLVGMSVPGTPRSMSVAVSVSMAVAVRMPVFVALLPPRPVVGRRLVTMVGRRRRRWPRVGHDPSLAVGTLSREYM